MINTLYYQTIFDKAGDAIFLHDINSAQILDVNEAAEQLTGFSKSQLLSMNVKSISAYQQGYDLEYALQQIEKSAQQGVAKFEWIIQTQTGQHIPASVCLKIIYIENHPKVLALVRDITELKQYQSKLQNRDDYLKSLLENSSDGIAILSPQAKLLYASPSLFKITGYRNRFALNKNILGLIHPNDRLEIRQFLFHDGLYTADTYTFRYQLLHHNGQWKYHEATCRNMLNDPNIQGFLINYRDITDQVEAENIARTREKQIGHMSRCKTMGELSTALAHELNQPLAALNNYIAGSIIRIENGLMTHDDILVALNSSLQQITRVNNIIQSMRSFLKKGEANFKQHQLTHILQYIMPLIELKAEQGACKIHYELAIPPIYIYADETLFSQVIINLVFNAVDALQQNSKNEREIFIRTWQHQNSARIAISDNGPGLRGLNPEQLFESFYSSKIDSMGIGLTLSRSIIENHQGYLWVCEGTPGAIFNISLQAQEREQNANSKVSDRANRLCDR